MRERTGARRQSGGRRDDNRRPSLSCAPASSAAVPVLLPMPSPQPASLSPSDFAYSRDRFRELAESALATARQLGATDAVVEVSEGVGLSVSVRKGQTENVERNRDKSLSITVFAGQRRGNASTSDYSPAGLEQDGPGRLGHRTVHRRGSRRRPARCGDARHRCCCRARPRPVPSLVDRRRRCDRAGADLRSGRARGRQAHHQFRRRRRVCPAIAFLFGQHAWLRRRLCQLAALALGRADRLVAGPWWRRHAARCLVLVDALGRRARRTAADRPLRRRACALALGLAQDQDLRGAGAVRVVAGLGPARRLRAGHQRRCALPQVVVPGRLPGPGRAARAHRRARRPAPPARQGQRAVRRRRRADRAARHRRRGRGADLFPLDLFGTQARHEDDRPRRRLAQHGADVAPDAARRRSCPRC